MLAMKVIKNKQKSLFKNANLQNLLILFAVTKLTPDINSLAANKERQN
jgi:hypothetical protein